MKLRIINGRLLDPANQQDKLASVTIAAGRIVGIDSTADFQADMEIDAKGLALVPGLIDLSVRLREPGNEHRATLESEMMAASLVLPPDTEPSLDEPGLVEMLKHRARKMHQANLYPLGATTLGLKGEALTEMAELTEAGCVAFSQANYGIPNLSILNRAMLYAKTFDYTF